jgi:hypothetical protein
VRTLWSHSVPSLAARPCVRLRASRVDSGGSELVPEFATGIATQLQRKTEDQAVCAARSHRETQAMSGLVLLRWV